MQRFLFLLLLTIAFPVIAWDAEIRVNGQLIPAELIEGYQAHYKSIENDCPPYSDIRDRDRIVKTWVRVQTAEERGMTISEKDAERIKKREEELTSERAKNDSEYRNKQHWLVLSNKSDYYWKGKINKVTEQDIETQYNRLIENKDPRFVNAPFFQRVQMESHNEQTLKQLSDQLRAGKTWRQVSKDVDPYDWNSHNKDLWHNFESLDYYESKAFHALKLNGRDLLRNDVIGPLSEHSRYRLLVILDKATVPVVPLNASLNTQKKWAAGEIRVDLYRQRHRELDSALMENVEVSQDGELVEIAFEHKRCPGQ